MSNIKLAIDKFNKKFESRPPRLSNSAANAIVLTPYQKSVLAGTILGDGSLKEPTGKFVNPRFQMKHSAKQFDWMTWKVKELTSITTSKPLHYQLERVEIKHFATQQIQTTGKFYEKLHYQSRALPCLKEFQQEISTNNQLDFSKPWLMKYVDEVALMVWWLDDGGLIGTGNRTGKLATHGFPASDLTYLQALLETKWSIKSTIQSSTMNGSTFYYLQFSTQMLKNLLLIVMKHIPVGCMLYKANLSYKNPLIQQHWISTMYDNIKTQLHPELELLVGPKPNKKPLLEEILVSLSESSLEKEEG